MCLGRGSQHRPRSFAQAVEPVNSANNVHATFLNAIWSSSNGDTAAAGKAAAANIDKYASPQMIPTPAISLGSCKEFCLLGRSMHASLLIPFIKADPRSADSAHDRLARCCVQGEGGKFVLRRERVRCRVVNPPTAAMAAHEAANSISGFVDMDKWAAMDGFTDSDEEADMLCSCGKVHGRPIFWVPVA